MNDLATIDPQSRTPAQVSEHVNMIAQLMRDVLKEGEHYGAAPGTSRDVKREDIRWCLHKSGAEKLGLMFGLVPTFEVFQGDFAEGHREYRITCKLSTRSGALVAEGVGICSTMESKYRWRKASRICPICGKDAILKSKNQPEWFCWTKKDGCGATWPVGAPEIEKQEVGRVPNPDIADVYNTVLKMGKKRAHVDAMITACAASDIFTQDVDEAMESEQDQRRAAAESAKDAQQPAPQQQPAPPTKTAMNGAKATAADIAAERQAKANHDATRAAIDLPQGTSWKMRAETAGSAMRKHGEAVMLAVWRTCSASWEERALALESMLAGVNHALAENGDDAGYKLLSQILNANGWPKPTPDQVRAIVHDTAAIAPQGAAHV